MTIDTTKRVKMESQNHDYTEEIMRASKFCVDQIKRGYTPQEAFLQVEGSYGFSIMREVMNSIKRVL